MPAVAPASTNARAVSVTYVRSRRGSRFPTRIAARPARAWPRIVGMIARADWRGPNVLKGRRTTTGTPKDRWYDSASLSAAILLAAYGDCACSGWSSSMGAYRAVP